MNGRNVEDRGPGGSGSDADGRRRALITGASSGIGMELARVMASQGWDLVLTARREKALEGLKSDLEGGCGVDVVVLPVDLSRPEAPGELVGRLSERGLEIDALVNNAGFGVYGPYLKTDGERELRMIDLNVRALTDLTKRLVPAMVERGRGRVMNVASTAAFQPGPWMAVYFATKAYVLHFSEALAHELHGTGVTVTALCPGGTVSGFQAAAAMEDSSLVKGRRLPSSAEVARFAYRAMMSGRRVAIHGLRNRVLAESIRLTPRRIATAVASLIMRPR